MSVALVEPGAVETELLSHMSPQMQAQSRQRLGNIERLRAEDSADAFAYVVTRPRPMAVSQILIRPTEQQP